MPEEEDVLMDEAANDLGPENNSAPGGGISGGSLGSFQVEDFPEALADAVLHGKRMFQITLQLPAPRERADFVGQLRQLMGSVGAVVGSMPPVANDQALASLSGDKLRLLVATVLDKEMLLTLLPISGDAVEELAVPRPAHPKPTAPAASGMTQRGGSAMRSAALSRNGPQEQVRTLLKPASQSAVKAAAAAAAAAAGTVPASGSSASPTVEETLRVSVSLLDELINNTGELVLARNQLVRASQQVASQFPHIMPLIQNLDSITSRIQERVMQARMQPVSAVFNKFPRVIRDLAKKLNKRIDLDIRGGEVELDKSVIEHLSDPLTHMIRNVADHAIEAPADRLKVGKAEAGRVELAAYHENGMVNISLSDDGAGIDHEKIKMKALEKGIITEHQADGLGEQESLNLIFAPGLSMAKKVSDVSGRGVGMDVVKTNIEKLGGTVHLESKVGKGTRIILKLPLTLAIIPAMIVSAGRQRFAVPEVGLVEIVRVTESDRANQIEMVGNAAVLRLRNTLLPLVDLADVLGVQRVMQEDPNQPDRRKRLADRRAVQSKARSATLESQLKDKRDEKKPAQPRSDRRDPYNLVAYVMVLNVGGNEFGLVVDEVLDSEEIVVKPLPSFFKENPCFSATTILGDGSVALIIDFAGIMEQARINFGHVEKAARSDIDDERRAALRERQNIILLETAAGQVMGIVHSMVRRVEKIPHKLMETIGGRPYVRYDGKTFRAVYPDQSLGLEHYSSSSVSPEDELCMVVPNIPNIQAGLIFNRIIDTRETHIDLDCRAITGEGLFGSAQIDDRVVLFPDVYALFELGGIRPPQPPPTFRGEGLKALVVDDTPFLRALTASYLAGVGFVVEQAEDGFGALGMLKNQHYDLLVTDLNMPVMDGFELAVETAATRNSDIPIIATTTSISSQLEQKCAQAGFASCVSTIDKFRLLRAVASLQA
ncbi:MAG: chemotaxis protein CheW [Magnetococcales bacterium]|nr:chemotaxis protein CheW [Magnetococcales bacterium]